MSHDLDYPSANRIGTLVLHEYCIFNIADARSNALIGQSALLVNTVEAFFAPTVAFLSNADPKKIIRLF